MFKKIVTIEPVNLVPQARERLAAYAAEVSFCDSSLADDAEIVARIGKAVIDAAPNLRYVGMCCSLYSEESANVDIAAARLGDKVIANIEDSPQGR